MLSALKNFGIAFLVSALVFGVVAYFLVGYISDTFRDVLNEENDRLDSLLSDVPEDMDEDKPDVSSKVPDVEGDSFTVLFGVTDRRADVYEYLPSKDKDIDKIKTGDKDSYGLLGKEYQIEKVKSIVLMRVSKETGEYTFVSIPSASKVYTQLGTGYTLLEDVMFYYDQEFFVEKVAAMTGITPDYTFFVNVTDMDDVIKAIGGFTCHIEEDIYTDGKIYFSMSPEESAAAETTVPETTAPVTEEKKDKDDKDDKDDKKDKNDKDEPEEEKIEIKRVVKHGNVTVGATNIEALLLCEGYSDSLTDRAEFNAEILQGIVARLAKMNNGNLSGVYKSITKNNKVKTDMTEDQFISKANLIRAYNDFEATIIQYPGDIRGDYFMPDVLEGVKQCYGLRIPADPSKVS